MTHRKSILAKGAMAMIAVGLIACNSGSQSGNLKVASGTADGSGADAKYPGTVYVEMTGTDFNNQPRIIRNVGNFVDLHLPGGQLTLVLSLADGLVNGGLPLFQTVDLKIYLSNGGDPVLIPGLAFKNDGSLVDAKGLKYTMVSIGLKAEKVGAADIADDQIRSAAQKLFIESPLVTAKGLNVREPITTYQLIAIPRSANAALQNLKAPELVPAESVSHTGLVMVGYGDTVVGSTAAAASKSSFGLSAALPNIAKRNFAPVEALNSGDPSKWTPLRKLWGDSPAVIQQVWEVSGSGLCGASDKDQSNYDTGAGVYSSAGLVGIAVRSTSISSHYQGTLVCSKTVTSDMATVVVSPNSQDIAAFKALVR